MVIYKKPIMFTRIFLDAAVLIFSLICASYLRFDLLLPPDYPALILAYSPYFFGVGIMMNYICGLYGSNFAHSGFHDAVKQLVAAFSTGCLLLILKYTGLVNFSGSILVIAMMIASILMVGIRFDQRFIHAGKTVWQRNSWTRVLIVGGGEATSTLIRHLAGETRLKKRPVAIISEDPDLWGTHINGVPIVGGQDMLAQAIEKYRIGEVIIALPSATKKYKRSLYDICIQMQVPLKIFPCVVNMKDAESTVPRLETVNFEDLLGRNAIRMEREWVAGYTKGKVVMVTGGAGSIGSEICRQILGFSCEKLIVLDFNENGLYDIENELAAYFPASKFEICLCSVREKDRLRELFAMYRPEVVFHAAAHKHVPMMEKNPLEAVKNNVFGTKNVIDCCIEFQTDKFILISSDKAVNPANIMGATKRICELLVQVHNGMGNVTMAAVRFGNVLGSNGSVIPIFKKQIVERKPVTVTHKDMTRYFMTIPEAVQLVLQASALAKGGDIFVLDMGEPVRIYDLACQLIRHAGLQPEKDIEIKFTGLRPGEKLFEELNLASEQVTKTAHDMISICHPAQTSQRRLNEALVKLQKCIDRQDEDAVIDCIFEFVPSKYRYVTPRIRTEDVQYQDIASQV